MKTKKCVCAKTVSFYGLFGMIFFFILNQKETCLDLRNK